MSGAEITDPGRMREPEHPAADPWGVVSLVIHDLAAHAVKSRFGPEADLSAAAQAALLAALGVRPAVPPLSSDPRVTAARDLLAGHDAPDGPGLRALLAIYRRGVRQLLDVLGQTEAPEAGQ